MKNTACTMPRGQVGDTCMLHKFQLAGIGGSSSTVVGHGPKCILVVLLCIKLILAKSMYTVCFLALIYIAVLLHWPMVIAYFYLWVARKCLSLFSTFMLGILNSWDQSICVS